MRVKSAWTIQSLFTCFFFNAVLVAAFLYLAQQVLSGIQQWIDPFLQPGTTSLPEDAQSAFTAMARMVRESQSRLLPIGAGIGAGITFFLWIVVMARGRSVAERAGREAISAAREERTAPSGPTQPGGAATAGKESKTAETVPEPSPQAAVQILSVLQREGRFVDFLQEDLSLYDDTQIGAAVRGIHEGCRQALKDYVQLKPVYEETEGAQVTVPQGFDAKAIRLTGSVSGNPPFAGVLRHRGWKVVRMELPKLTADQKSDWILAPAEVEIEG
jgi:hypothetical protein